MKICKIKGCNNIVDAKGYCQKHYLRYKKGLDPNIKTRRDNNDYYIKDNKVTVKTRGSKTKNVIVDLDMLDDVEEILNKYVVSGNKNCPSITEMIDGKKVNISLVYKLFGELDEDLIYTYKNENGYDLTRDNLEIISKVEFARINAVKNKKYKVPGLSLKKDDRWVATISYEGKSIYLGIFDSEDEAVEARIAAEKEYWGNVHSKID